MQKEIENKKNSDPKPENPVGYPLYPASEDIYNQDTKVFGETADVSDLQIQNEKKFQSEKRLEKDLDIEFSDNEDFDKQDADEKNLNEKGFDEDISGSDLDVPGSELDDAQENTGSEDEENNYYSIGGDRHDDLDEDKPE